MIITIDGPAGAGKSSVARALAQRLGFDVLDTGAMYRAVGLAVLQRGIDIEDEQSLEALLRGLRLEMPGGVRVVLNGTDVTLAIRSPEATAASSPVATSKAVRRRLAELQRELAARRDLITEGRDQGTVVFPGAFCKFFLTASAEERARRRYQEIVARGEAADFTAILRAQEARDLRDASRDLAPMRPANDAIVLDTTGLSLNEVVERLYVEVEGRRSGA